MSKFSNKPCWIKHTKELAEQQGKGNWKKEEELLGLTLIFPFEDNKYKKWITNWRVGISAPGKYWYEEHDEYRVLQKKIRKEKAWTKVFSKHIPSGSSTIYCLWREQDIKEDMTVNGFQAYPLEGKEKKWFTVFIQEDKTIKISVMSNRWDIMLNKQRSRHWDSKQNI